MLKKLFTVVMVTMSVTAFAQNVGVNGDGTSPDVSAMLDIKSTDKGVLIPRMTMAERDAIASPATGLLVFQTDNTAGFYYNSGTPGTPTWVMISNASNLEGTQNGVLVGQGVGTPSTFSAASTAANQVLATPTSGGAPAWVDPITTLPLSSISGSGPVILSGTGDLVGGAGMSVAVQGPSGGVMYGQGAGVDATFTPASTGANQVLSTPISGGAPFWVDANTTLTTNHITPGTGSSVVVGNGTSKILGSTPVTVDVQGTSGGVMYGTGTGTAALFSAAGTTGQYLRSNGTGAPAFATPQSQFSVSISCGVPNTATIASGTHIWSGGYALWTNTAPPGAGTTAVHAILTGSFFQANKATNLTRVTGWIYQPIATGSYVVNITRFSNLSSGTCGNSYALVGQVGTILGTCTVNFTGTQYTMKFDIDLTTAPVALAPGDVLVASVLNNSGVGKYFYMAGTADFTSNVQ